MNEHQPPPSQFPTELLLFVRNLQLSLCVHSVCRCGRQKPNSDTRARLMEIFHNNKLRS